MQTIAVHAHILGIAAQSRMDPPPCWSHDLVAGSLTFSFPPSPNTFTWDAETVASIAREAGPQPGSDAGRQLVAQWAALESLIERMERRPPDRVLVDHEAQVWTLLWQAEKVAVVVGPEGAGADELAVSPPRRGACRPAGVSARSRRPD